MPVVCRTAPHKHHHTGAGRSRRGSTAAEISTLAATVSRRITIPLNERKPLFLTGDEIRNHLRMLETPVSAAAYDNVLKELERMRQSVSAAAHDNAVYVEALRDLMAFFDKVTGGSSGSWCVAEVKRIEEIRLLSLGV